LCWIDYEQAFEVGGIDSTFVRNEINKQYSITTTGGGFKGFNFSSPANGFVSASSKVSFELDAVSITNQPSGGAVFLLQDQPMPEIVAGFFNQAGTIIDGIGGAPIGGATYQTGYIMGMTFDFDAGTALASDNAFLSNTSLGVAPYAPDQPLYQGWIGASFAATTNIFSPNTGDRPFVLPQSDGVGFCNVVPIPPPVFCSPVTLTTQDGVPPDLQTITVGGTNNLTITATSLGNDVLNSGAVANQVFNTQTEEVKIETRITSASSTFNVSPPAVGIGFFHNVLPLGSIPVLITNLAYIPSQNLVVGTNGIPYGVYPVPDYPTDLAIYLDPTPQQKKYVFQVNPDPFLAGSVNVHGVVTAVGAGELQEDIALNIVANGFTDPNIESLAISPDDNRDVIITYTVGAGDYPVSVIPTNCVIFENVPDSRDFAEGKSRAKFYNFQNNLSIFPNIGVSAGYDNLQDVYMAVSVDAGDGVLGESVVQTINFGSSAFELGEDAERWCNI
jgi:hypothetical protein